MTSWLAGGKSKRLLEAMALAAALCLVSLTAPPSRAAPDRADLEAARERLLELERDFEIVVERYNLVHERLETIRVEIGTTELAVRGIRERMEGKQHAAIELAEELYKSGASGAALESVLSAPTFAAIDTRIRYLQASEEAHAKVFERLAVDRRELDRHVAALEEARASALEAEQRLAALREDIETKVAEQKDEIAQLNAAIQRAEARQAARERAAAEAAAATEIARIDAAAGANTAPAPAPNAGAEAAVEAALSQVGKPYQWGAAGPDAYDCSGLTMWAWAHAGVSLPHNSGMQYDATKRVAQSDWQPGDLLFYGSPIHHVGMYIGNGKMVEAPYSGQQVRVASPYRSDYVGAGRPGV